MTKLGPGFKVEKGPDGKTRVVEDTRAAEAKLDVSARIAKRANRDKPKLATRAKARGVRRINNG